MYYNKTMQIPHQSEQLLLHQKRKNSLRQYFDSKLSDRFELSKLYQEMENYLNTDNSHISQMMMIPIDMDIGLCHWNSTKKTQSIQFFFFSSNFYLLK